MTKIFILISMLVVLVSCSKQSTSEQDSLNVEKVSGEKAELSEAQNDSVLYVNSIGYFPQTNEFYVPLSFNKSFGDDIFDVLSEKTDSIIYDNGEVSRRRLPMKVAREALDFRQLDEVSVYDANHQFITKAKLTRAEYYDDLNSYFIAVFRPEGKVPKNVEDFYCFGSVTVALNKIKTQPIEDEKLTERIKDELDIRPLYVSRVKHIKVQPDNSVYSIYAYVKTDGGAISYLTEYKDSKIRVLHKLEDEVAIDGFMPISIVRNGRPILLFHIILPDSDAVDDYVVATFNGSEYKLEKDNRISLHN